MTLKLHISKDPIPDADRNELVAKDARLESIVVPIRDGLSVARVRD